MGRKPLALVVKKAGAKLSEKDLRKHIRGFVDKGITSKQVVLLKVQFVNAIEKSSVGKINKNC
jgi:fatty-acyl-CoA synthase